MIEITQEAKGEIMEHAEKAYEHLGSMLDCLEEACDGGSQMGQRGAGAYRGNMGYRGGMGMREDDEFYVRRFNGDRMGMRGMGRRDGYQNGIPGGNNGNRNRGGMWNEPYNI